MSDIKRVKIESIIQSQIPEYLSEESPLFVEFLRQYYKSLENQSGAIDIALNIDKYKSITAFNKNTLKSSTITTSDVLSFDDVINVESTVGWPDSYGLLKINDEIITYTSKTPTSFVGCVRGFSGIDSIESSSNPSFLSFSESSTQEHLSGSEVLNLSNLFLLKFFEKFKTEFFNGFELRNFDEDTIIENILYSARAFYASKGTDVSYKLLFKILYGSDIEIIKPQDYTLVPSSNTFFQTKNILVEKITGGDPENTKGNFLFQETSAGTISASIFNVEFRPVKQSQFYEISLDSTSLTGNFEVSGKTKILESVQVGADNIFVDSTVGFSESGSILVKPTGQDYIKISYTGKNINQFTGVTGVTFDLDFGLDLIEEKFAYSYIGVGNTSRVEFRLINVIDDIDFSKTSNLRVGDKIRLSGFGKDLTDRSEFNSWIYNIPTNHNINFVNQVDPTKFRIYLRDGVSFYKNEIVTLEDKFGNKTEAEIIAIEYDTGVLIRKYSNRVLVQVSSPTFFVGDAIVLKKKIYKSEHYSDYFDGMQRIQAGVQNTYLDSSEEFFYVASSGFPHYTIFSTDNKKYASTTISGIQTTTLNVVDHKLLSGDSVYYDPVSSTNSGINTGYYYVSKIDNDNISLCYSRSDIFSKKLISVNSGITSDVLYKSGYENSNITHQKILKKFPFERTDTSFDNKNFRTTNNRQIGLLANGVEILSPSLFDENIYYGQLTSIDVTNAGSGYDVINVAPLEIKDDKGSGVKAHLNVSGSFKQVKIVTPGVGYLTKPKLTVSGGNGSGCVLETNLVKTQITAGFKADINVSTANNTIDFLDRLSFIDGEEVTYNSNNNDNLGGIVNGSKYFVGILSDTRIKIFNKREDAINKTNEIDITGISSGFHYFTTDKNKNTFTEIYVKDPGSGYSNRKVKVPSILSSNNRLGINTFDSYIYAKNHGFNSGELVTYNSSETPISGVSTDVYYYVTVLDSNRFRLSEAGIGTTLDDSNYRNKVYTRFPNLGLGTHTIGYPPITISVESTSSIGSTTIIQPELKPVVTGSIDDVYLEDGGIGFGCTDIINYHRRPNVGIVSVTSQAVLKPIIVNGVIVDVQIVNRGNGYRSDSEIVIQGQGSYAQIEPIVSEGRLQNVQIVFGGVGYASSNTSVILQNRGVSAKFLANVNEWKINQVEKLSDSINVDDDGVFYTNKNQNLGLQFVNFYVPKKLRYQLDDNFTDTYRENSGTLRHSPIVGYAYDGNPIYGPYGYSNVLGGVVSRMESGYVLNAETDPALRPSIFSAGYFMNDYVFTGTGNLDSSNGRYCVTPEYPDGVYAYFTTIDVNSSNESTPKFPYLIGDYFNNDPVIENLLPAFNQDFPIFDTSITRNVGPYYLSRTNSFYDLIDKVSDDLKQEFRISSTNFSGIESVSIFSPGDDYQIDDKVIINSEGSEGGSTNIVVSELLGKEVDSFFFDNEEIISSDLRIRSRDIKVLTSSPHGIIDGQSITISGVSTITSSNIEGTRVVSVLEKEVELLDDIAEVGVTGVSTFITVKDTSGFKANNFIGIGTEVLLITRVSEQRSGFFVNRIENTGIHTAKIDNVVLLPTEFTFTQETPSPDITFENYVTFFDPIDSIGFGSTGRNTTVVGFGTTTFENRFIPARSIYIPNHKFFTGQKVIYNSGSQGVAGTSLYVNNVGSGVSFNLYDDQELYVVNLGQDYIGLSTLGFTTSAGIGTNNNSLEFWDQTDWYGVIGAAHSLTTTYKKITASLNKITGVVTTKVAHNLQNDDIISFSLSAPLYEEEVKVVFDPVNRKVLLRELSFSDSDVDVSENSIDISSYLGDIKTGDKVSYISDNPISGLVNYGRYYVLRDSRTSIKLCLEKIDIENSNFIELSSVGGTTHKFYFVNPELSLIRTSTVKFDLSDSSLSDLDLRFYSDEDFSRTVEVIGSSLDGFVISRDGIPGSSGAYVKITLSDLLSKKQALYYNLVSKGSSDVAKTQISPDKTIFGNNKITVKIHTLTDSFKVKYNSPTKFSIFNKRTLAYNEKDILSSSDTIFTYKTKSKTAYGPISKLKINFPGRGYKKLPFVEGIESEKGNNAVIKLISPTVGRVETFERVKDGFDYPTDPTLSPSLSVPTVVGLKDIRTIDYVGITTGGRRFNSPPKLIVKDGNSLNTDIQLEAGLSAGSIVDVKIIQNSTSLSAPLQILSTYNSNGYDIDSISVSGDTVTLELANTPGLTPLISAGYGSTVTPFPFAIGDSIFIENCRLTSATQDKANFNSESYSYSFFEVTSVNENNNTVSYSMAGISTGDFGTYDSDFVLGYVVNSNDLPTFEMVLKDDVKYLSNERITSSNNAGFSGRVMENGWDVRLNQMRMSDISGNLEVGDRLTGEISKITGVVEYFDQFNLFATLGVVRTKSASIDLTSGILNDFQHRISDNFYYQKFSYAIRGDVPYSTWRESVRSIVHPSGFQEFSDLEVFTEPTLAEVTAGFAKSTNMKPKLLSEKSVTFINIDNVSSMNIKTNFARVYEDNASPDGSVNSIFFDEGISLKPYIVNKTNKVLNIDDISSQFDGSAEQYVRGRFADASDLLELNREFIQEEVVAFVEYNYPDITSSITYSREKCKRDTGFIVDALSHDLKYNSNNKSVEAGIYYWNAGVSYVTNETEETLFAYNYVKFISQYIINNQTPPTLYQSSVNQEFNYQLIQDPTNEDQSRFKDSRNLIVANKREIVEKSLASVAIGFSDFYFPGDTQTNERSRYYDGYRLIQQNKTEIIDTAWTNTVTVYPGISTTQTKCKRDLGYFVDAISADVFTGGNNYSREFILQYFDATGNPISNGLSGEEAESIYAFVQARDLMKSAISNQLTITDLTVTEGPATYGGGGGTISRTSTSACSDVQSNINSLVGIVTVVVGSASTGSLPSVNYGTLTPGGNKCYRDLTYIVDGIAEDISYGTNQHTIYNTKKYFTGAGAARTDGLLGEESESVYAFESARDYCRQAVTNKLNYKDLTITADNAPGSDFGQVVTYFTPSNATYDPVSGISTITIIDHGLEVGEHINIVVGGLVFTCDLDGNVSQTGYPRSTDPAANTYIRINSKTDDTITVNVGSGGTNTSVHTFVSATENSIVFGANTDNRYNEYLCSDVQSNITTLVGILTSAVLSGSLAGIPTENYGLTDCADVRSSIGNYIGIITTIIGLGTEFAPEITYPSLTRGGSIVGLTTFKLTNKGTPLFKHTFDYNSIDIANNTFNIINHNYQSGQELLFEYSGGSPVGIATTSYVSGTKDVLMEVTDFDGSAIFENGYNTPISGTISGTVPSGVYFGFTQFTQVIGVNTGIGTNALFTVSISYQAGTGDALSTSIAPTYGGSGYAVGEQVSISGTYFGGTSPTNDLSFVITETAPTTIQSEANQSYSEVPSSDASGATFNISRDGSGSIAFVEVLNGGSGYSISSTVSVAGTYIGGSDSRDDLTVSPLVLGANTINGVVYVDKLNDNEFRLSGLSTSIYHDIVGVDTTSTYSVSLTNPNPSVLITIDGIIQTAIRRKSLNVSLASSVSTASTTILSVSSGINSIETGDVINIDSEYVLVKTIGVTSANQLSVERGYLGTTSGIHTIGAASTVLTGDFNIVGDTLYLSTAPYGKIGPVGLETGSNFAGRFFSRRINPSLTEDRNILLDDISLGFTGAGSTEFTIKSEGDTTTTLFNDVNFSTDINNNPIILINNVPQEPGVDFTIDGTSENVIRFLSGQPESGKIAKVSITDSYGYTPRISAAATAVVSAAGTISEIILTGDGSGYRTAPIVSIASTIGTGASVTATVSAAGTVTGFSVVVAGAGYTRTSVPEVVIGFPTAYSRLSLGYASTSSGDGRNAKINIEVGLGSSITSFKIDDVGVGYKVGDVLSLVGVLTNTSISTSTSNISDVTYNNVTGVTSIVTIEEHGLVQNDFVTLTGIAFTCGYDEVGIQTFSYDNVTGICTVTTYSPHGLLLNGIERYLTPSTATYDPNDGTTVLTIYGHSLSVGDFIKLEDNSLTFTCALDSDATEHTYPRPTDPASGQYLEVTNVSGNDVTINVGAGGTDTSVHTFVRSTPNSVVVKGVKNNKTSSEIFLHNLPFACAIEHAGVTTTIFPDNTSPYGLVFPVINSIGLTTFTMQAGVSTIPHVFVGWPELGISTFSYDNATGVSTVQTVQDHGFVVNDVVTLKDLPFSCTSIGSTFNVTNLLYNNTTGNVTIVLDSDHGFETGSYVRLADIELACSAEHAGVTSTIFPYVGSSTNFAFNSFDVFELTGVGTNRFSINVGPSTIPHTYVSGGTATLGITTTIFPDGTSTYGYTFRVSSVTSSTQFTINSGISTIAHSYEGYGQVGVSTFEYTESTGVSTCVLTENHNLSVGDYVTLNGLEFSCAAEHAGVTTTIFPDGTSPYGNTFLVTNVGSTTSFTFNAGISTIAHIYEGSGTANRVSITKKVPTSQRVLKYTDQSTDDTGNFMVVSVGSTNTFEVVSSASTIAHYYVQGGVVGFPQFQEFKLRVDEVQNASFSGFYPGQFLKFNDISQNFNGFRRKFTLSYTINGVRSVLSLRTQDGSDLDITNNIFIYINEVLQVPGVSYTYSGSRVQFTEAPKAGSKCTILYYKGSDLDIETIDPPKTIKEGDLVVINENINDPLDIDQFERRVKKIASSDELQTFTYASVGIDTNTEKIRPLTWKKQTSDTIITGTLYPKARPSLKAKVRPTATIIKPVGLTDSEIYVDNIFPLFTDSDTLTEDLRDVLVIENRNISEATGTAVVSTSSTISSVQVTSSGVGYAYTLSPRISISESFITKKDIIYDWNTVTGITTNYDLNSIDFNKRYVSVGNTNVIATSYDGIVWESSSISYGSTIPTDFYSLESVSVGNSAILMSSGSDAVVIKASDFGNTITAWQQIELLDDVSIPGLGVVNRVATGYTGALREITYSSVTDTWVTIGLGGTAFYGVGVGTESLVSRTTDTLSALNSVVFGKTYFVAVGNDGTITSSNDGNIWETASSPVVTPLNKVIFDGTYFIVVGDSGAVLRSIDRGNYEAITNNLGSLNILDIYYSNGIYVIIGDTNEMYYSLDLSNWIVRSTGQSNLINDMLFVDSVGTDGRFISVGVGATVIYADPTINRATGYGNVYAGLVTSVTITNPGFGYDTNSVPPVIIEPESFRSESIRSIKAIGDHGNIINVITYLAGTPGIGTTTPKVSFVLQSEQYDNSTLGIGYSSLNIFGITNSQLSKGDYFVITDSNVEIGEDLVGITTFLGGMSNYPTSKVGTATSFLDGVYIVEDVTSPSLGIVTVTCNFAPSSGGNYVEVYPRGASDTGIGTNGFYGRYSWGKIYDYQNRVLSSPKEFETFNDNGIVGISTSPKLIRTRSLIGN